jgi:hypothetical protein
MGLMKINRRGVLASGLAVAGMAPFAGGAAAQAQAPAATPPLADRLAARAREARLRLDYRDGTFAGPGWERLLAVGRDSHFFMLGEEHGIAENPKLAAALFRELVPSGYSRLGIEISPPMASELDRALQTGGMAGLRRFLAEPANAVAFFGMREEAELLAAARAAVPGRKPVLWGVDYEVGADRRLIALLKQKRKPQAAVTALAALEAASNASWARYQETRSPQYIYGFSGDPALVRAVRAAWPGIDARSSWILETLEETFEINGLWAGRQAWQSNARRVAFMRSNFLRHWRAEGGRPRTFLKLGASHLMRGRSSTEVFDLGTLIPELAQIEGVKSFQLLVLPGRGASLAQFNPGTFRYEARPAQGDYSTGLQPIIDQAFPDAFTLFDAHRLRPLLGFSRQPQDATLMRMVHGFDAILVMSGSTPSTNL